MKNKILSLHLMFTFLIVFKITANSQEYISFPQSNAIWSEVFTSQQPFFIETYQYGVIGDTTINSTVYQKIYRLNDTIYPLVPGQYCGAIREDNSKRIFVIGSECTYPGSGQGEVLLYDFSKSVGDTVFVGIDGVGPEGYLIINNIDSILIENNYRRTFHFTTLEGFFWIEGIGSTRGIFSPITAQTSGYQKWELICFNQDNIVKYLNPKFNSCFPVLTAVDNHKQTLRHVKIFPHPVSDISIIELNKGILNSHRFEIFNALGIKVTELIIEGKDQIEINAINFRPGFYFFLLSGQNSILETGKIIFK